MTRVSSHAVPHVMAPQDDTTNIVTICTGEDSIIMAGPPWCAMEPCQWNDGQVQGKPE